MLRDADGRQQIVTLDSERIVIGRDVEHGIRLQWSAQVSRVHAVLERVGEQWTVVDDGLSRNGTFVNGRRVVGRQRLSDGDVIRCAEVEIGFCDPVARRGEETLNAPERRPTSTVSPAQHRVLVALCRPLRDSPYAGVATNKQVAAELSLSVDAVKTHMRRLFDVLEVDDLPQNQKRAQLAWKALSSSIVTAQDLHDA